MDKVFRIRLNGSEFDLEQTKKGIKVNNYQFKPEVIFNGKFYRVFVNGREFKVEYRDNDILLDGKIIDFDFKPSPQIQLKKGSLSKRGADIRAAIPGKIVEINPEISENPSIANEDPYDGGWLVIFEAQNLEEELNNDPNLVKGNEVEKLEKWIEVEEEKYL